MTLTGSGGNATIDTTGGDISLSGVLSGPGELFKTGGGLLLLSGMNTCYVNVSSGTVQLTAGQVGVGSVGYGGNGTFVQSGTSQASGSPAIGVGPGDTGTYILSGSGYFSREAPDALAITAPAHSRKRAKMHELHGQSEPRPERRQQRSLQPRRRISRRKRRVCGLLRQRRVHANGRYALRTQLLVPRLPRPRNIHSQRRIARVAERIHRQFQYRQFHAKRRHK